MGIKFWEDLFSQVFHFAIFYNHEKRAKLKTNKVLDNPFCIYFA